MPIKGFRDLQGVTVPIADIDFVRDAARFNTSPATLAMLLDNVTAREHVDFSASQLGTTTRQHLLRSQDYYPPTAQAMSAYMGTVKHQQVNVQRDRLIVEQRFTSKRDPRISGQIDHAPIIELTDDGTLVVDLYDLKNPKWYSVTLCAKDVWKNHPEYAWQLNLCAALMEENGLPCPDDCSSEGYVDADGDEPCTHGKNWCGLMKCPTCRGEKVVPVRVRNLYLEFIASDSSYKFQEEATRLKLPEYQKVIIQVERKSADETYAVFDRALRMRDAAIETGRAPLCEDRWSNRTISDLRCKHYCDVQAECIALAHSQGERHPLDPLRSVEDALAASVDWAQEKA